MSPLIEGIVLFNQGHYWHAHEQWERCWLVAAGTEATFYQGLIQAAAALVHWQRQNPRGLHLNWQKARPKLVSLPPTLHELDLARLIVEMDRFVQSGGNDLSAPQLHRSASA